MNFQFYLFIYVYIKLMEIKMLPEMIFCFWFEFVLLLTFVLLKYKKFIKKNSNQKYIYIHTQSI